MRTKKILFNTIASLILQVVTVICGFILPRFFISTYGSEINGAVSSISQFLGYISILEAGVGGVTRAALYKPLAEENHHKISGIFNATQSFFRKIAYIFIIYVVILSVTYKYISGTELEAVFTTVLVFVLAIATFVQYYFGITYTVLLNADQRAYIQNALQILTVILNTIISVFLIRQGCDVILVKTVSVGVYILRPVLLNVICKRIYRIDKNVSPDNNAIKNRWNGFGHHIAFYIHNNIDVMVVTVVLGLKWASVYSVYYMIVSGVKNIIGSFIGSNEAAFGNMIAKNEQKVLQSRFKMVETLTSGISICLFSVTGMLLLDFLRIYTKGVTDISYIVVSLAILFPLSEALHCIKQIYHNLILAAGHYKETQTGAFIEAGMNVVLSIVLSFVIGLPGILIATVISTVYRVIDYAIHLKHNIINRELKVMFKRQLINVLNALSIILVCLHIPFFTPATYFEWVLKAVPITIIAFVMTLFWNVVFYPVEVKEIATKIIRIFKK